MKKQLYALISTLLLVVIVTSPAYASTSDETNITSVQELHDIIVTNDLASLNEDGKLFIDEKAIELNVEENIYNEYIDDIEKLNKGIEEGVMYFDSNLQIKMYSPEVIEEMVYEEALNNPGEKYLPISPMAVPDGPPAKNVKALVVKNRAEAEDIYSMMKTNEKYGGGNAFSGTVGWWVGKVKPGGAWDYKVVDGYSPWNKEWKGTFFTAGTSYINSAYIGNYNYGYTGEMLFTKQVLLAAGDGVSIITTFMDNIQKGKFKASLDGEDDKIPVRKGFDDYVNYN
ncbi:polymorphic toxin type 44 domain-containing protein [Lysinibacillus xylanilyticus]|uniref:polymorphic toxin type 44 domain-containing protein n=1 Tax=Lysinibacillus xylanilyticus TaxID=582475 RepID=UPI0010636823